MLKESYVYNLINQYLNATGIEKPEIYDDKFMKTVLDWYEKRKFLGDNYLLFLDDLNIRYKDSDCMEVEKGIFDSLTFKRFKNGIITPYEDGLYKHTGEVIVGDLSIAEDIPAVLSYDGDTKCLNYFKLSDFNTFMINNPYEQGSLKNWDVMINNDMKNAIVGMYGQVSDKDFLDKLDQMRVLQEKLTCDHISEISLKNGNYCYVLASKKSVRK